MNWKIHLRKLFTLDQDNEMENRKRNNDEVYLSGGVPILEEITTNSFAEKKKDMNLLIKEMHKILTG